MKDMLEEINRLELAEEKIRKLEDRSTEMMI